MGEIQGIELTFRDSPPAECRTAATRGCPPALASAVGGARDGEVIRNNPCVGHGNLSRLPLPDCSFPLLKTLSCMSKFNIVPSMHDSKFSPIVGPTKYHSIGIFSVCHAFRRLHEHFDLLEGPIPPIVRNFSHVQLRRSIAFAPA